MKAFDLIVIGTGPAGVRAAIQAAKLGKRVAACERRGSVGGVSVHLGTIPSKTFREAVLSATSFRYWGLMNSQSNSQEELCMKDLRSRAELMVKREAQIIDSQLRRNGVKLFYGEASFIDPRRMLVESATERVEIEASFIVLAPGSTAAMPEGVLVDGQRIVTSDEILGLNKIPGSMVVIGGGVVGVEYASMFGVLGVEVTLVDRRPRLLEFLDAEISDALAYQMRSLNCVLRLEEEVDVLKANGDSKPTVSLRSGKRIQADVLLYSIGRVGATETLNLSAAGISAESRGRLVVDESYRTIQPHIYAVGDVIGFPALAATAMEQGRAAVCHAFEISCKSVPKLFPYGIYSIPGISMVGKTEAQLTADGVAYEIGLARYREIARGGILGDDSGLLKLLFHAESRQLLGVHIIGTSATELIHIGQAVLAFAGTIDYFIDNVFNYPTFAECYKVAALDGYNKL